MAINTSNNKVRIISTTVSGLTTNSKFSDIKSPALVVNTSEGGVFYADGTGGTSLKQLAALPNHTHGGYATTTQLADYLPKTGGQLATTKSTILSLNNTNSINNEVGLRFDMNSTETAWVGYTRNIGTYLYTYTGPHKLGIKDDGTGFIDGNTIIHSGNIGQQIVASATNATKSESLAGGHGVSNAANYSITYLAGGFINNTTPTANQVYLGTSSNWDVISSPVHDGTDTVQNIMSLRLGWNKSYWHEIATGPNANNKLYHRSVNVGTPRSWALFLDSLNYTSYCSSLGHTHDYLPLSGGTMTGDITLPNTKSIIQHQKSYSNYTIAVKWLQGGVSEAAYDPQIGHYNMGDTNGAIVLLPYSTNAEAWEGNDGLYVGSSNLKFNGTKVSLEGHTHSYLSSQTWRPIKINNSQKLANSSSNALDISAGSNVTLTWDSTNSRVTIAATNSDTKVTTSASSSKLFIIGKTDASKATASAANYNASVYIDGGYLYSGGTKVSVNGHTHSGYATTAQLANYLPLTGGTLTGNLTLYNGGGSVNSPAINFLRGTYDDTYYDWSILDNGGHLQFITDIGSSTKTIADFYESGLKITGDITADSFTGNATSATSATYMSSFAEAASDSTKRYIWMSHNDNSGRSAYTNKLTFQTSTNTLFVNDKAVSLEGHGTHITSDSQTWSGNKSFKNYIILSEQNSSSSPNSASQIVFGTSGAKLTSNGTGNVIINPNSGSTGQIIFMPGSDPYIKINGIKVSVEGHSHSYSTTDTKNTAGSSNKKTKIFVVGAASQSSTGVTTYSDISVYITDGKLYASNFITSSDERIKTNIKEVKNSVDSLGLRFVEFDYKDSSNHSAGHIAQEVKEVLPEFVHEDTTNEEHMLSIDYTGLHSVQIKALLDRIIKLEEEIKILKSSK